jgi:hypothetical protein
MELWRQGWTDHIISDVNKTPQQLWIEGMQAISATSHPPAVEMRGDFEVTEGHVRLQAYTHTVSGRMHAHKHKQSINKNTNIHGIHYYN